MPATIKLGTATSHPGSLQYGQWEAFTHATGLVEFLPVIIAQGNVDGPCIWLTAAIHGTEHTGPWVIHELLTPGLLENLRGTIVAIPSLCPVGVRVNEYVPYIVDKNPNRLWPEDKPKPAKPDPEKQPPSPLEKAYERLFDEIKASADFLIDFHNATIGSIPFAFRDRVLYREDQNGAENKGEAQQLAQRLGAMLEAFGFTVINESLAEKYIDDDMHRSTSGSVLTKGRIPAFTVELGCGQMPDRAIVDAALVATRNVLRWAGMLGGEMEPITSITMLDTGYPVRSSVRLRMPCPGVAIHLKEAGDMLSIGEPVAELRDIWGRPLPESLLVSDCEGFILARSHGIFFNQGEALYHLAIRDDQPLIGPYPPDFFKEK
jgi:uncharacterized protein